MLIIKTMIYKRVLFFIAFQRATYRIVKRANRTLNVVPQIQIRGGHTDTCRKPNSSLYQLIHYNVDIGTIYRWHRYNMNERTAYFSPLVKNKKRGHTFFLHSNFHAFVQTTILTLISMMLINRTIPTASARISQVSPYAALEETLAAFASVLTVMLSTWFISTHLNTYLRSGKMSKIK